MGTVCLTRSTRTTVNIEPFVENLPNRTVFSILTIVVDVFG